VALVAIAEALRPDGKLAFDICDLEWGRVRRDLPPLSKAGDDGAIITKFTAPAPDRFVRDITTFLPDEDGSWRRSREQHESVLIDTARLPAPFDAHGVDAVIGSPFGSERLSDRLQVVTGQRRGSE
jgi:hypothetical protein